MSENNKYCELIKTCWFFNGDISILSSTANMLKEKYCFKNYSDCARYAVFKILGKEKVPKHLLPSQVEKIDDIVSLGNY
jgi:hypothetical protein